MINQTNSMMKDNIYSIFCTLSHKSNLKPNLQEKRDIGGKTAWGKLIHNAQVHPPVDTCTPVSAGDLCPYQDVLI